MSLAGQMVQNPAAVQMLDSLIPATARPARVLAEARARFKGSDRDVTARC